MNRRAFLLAVLLVLGTGAVALAAIPSADGTIHGCRDNRTGTLRVIDAEAGQTCTSRETALTWNQTGPVGPAGPPGPAGVSGYEIVSAIADVPARGAGQAQPTCPAGKVVLGGGFELSSAPYVFNLTVQSSKPQFNGAVYSWLVGVHNENDVPRGIEAYAICATVT